MTRQHVRNAIPSLERRLAMVDGARAATMRLLSDLGEPGASARVARAASGPPNLDTSPSLLHSGPGHTVTILNFGDGILEARSVFVENRQRIRAPKTEAFERPEAKREDDETKREWRARRAKRSLRYRCLALKADHMITFTKRDKFETVEEMRKAWRAFCQLVRRMPGIQLQYVAVPEPHADGRWHLHVAVRGRYDVNMLRRLWFRALGARGDEKGEATPGNIHALAFHNRRKAGFQVASYMSKYLGKSFAAGARGRLAYWCSKGLVPQVHKVFEPVGDCLVVRLFARLHAIAPRAQLRSYEWEYLGMTGVVVRSF